jgi:hypothetical protein
MRKYLLYSTVMMIGLSLLFVSACRKHDCQDPQDPNCENFDPCYGKRMVHTDFIMTVGHGGFPPPGPWCELPLTDTFVHSYVVFEVPKGNVKGCSYQWKIGTESGFRYGEKFEVDFSPFREQGNWDAIVPITLTIRRPLDGCLGDPADTVVTVTRNLVFSSKSIQFITEQDDSLVYEGYFHHTPDIKSQLRFFYVKKGSFRNYNAPYIIVTGYPGTDTLLWITGNCGIEVCSNYNSVRWQMDTYSCSLKELSGYLSALKIRYHGSRDVIEISRDFRYPGGTVNYTFSGSKQ